MSDQPERESVQDDEPQPTKHSDAERVTSEEQSGSGETDRGPGSGREDETLDDVGGG